MLWLYFLRRQWFDGIRSQVLVSSDANSWKSSSYGNKRCPTDLAQDKVRYGVELIWLAKPKEQDDLTWKAGLPRLNVVVVGELKESEAAGGWKSLAKTETYTATFRCNMIDSTQLGPTFLEVPVDTELEDFDDLLIAEGE